MTLLVISPDYASHLLPLATLATAWRDAGERVVVASGPATAGDHRRVRLRARRSAARPRVRIPASSGPRSRYAGEDDALRGFFAATERGMVATLLLPGRGARADLLWDPVDRPRAGPGRGRRVRPDQVIVDHLAFSARLALLAGGVPHADVVLGHPQRAAGRRRGLRLPARLAGGLRPATRTRWPPCMRRCRRGPGRLHRRMERRPGNACPAGHAVGGCVHRARGPGAAELPGAAARPGAHGTAAAARLPRLRGAGRAGVPTDIARLAGAEPTTPLVYVSFGSFLSVRADVLARVVDALRPCRCGSRWPSVPPTRPCSATCRRTGWCASSCRRSPCCERAALTVTHGGNNSVTESLTVRRADAGAAVLHRPVRRRGRDRGRRVWGQRSTRTPRRPPSSVRRSSNCWRAGAPGRPRSLARDCGTGPGGRWPWRP